MSVLSALLAFFKYDPTTDGASTFNIKQALNDNWDTAKTALEALDAGKAELGEDGKLQPEQLPALDYDPAGAAQAVQGNLQAHMGDAVRHVTAAERAGWDGKQAALTFDAAPTAGSGNPVTSAGVKAALDGKAGAAHGHAAADISSGTLDAARLPTVPVAKGGTGAATAAGARANLETMKPVWAEVVLPVAGWALEGGAYVQTAACAAAKAAMKGYPNVGLKKSADAAARELEAEAYGLIEFVDTLDGSVKATCGDKAPEVAVTILFSGGVA